MNAFQLRLELLKMAQGLVSDEYSYKRSAMLEQWQSQVSSAQVAGTPSPTLPELPPFPTEEEIVKRAETLNNFVSQTPPNPTPPPEVKITKKTNS